MRVGPSRVPAGGVWDQVLTSAACTVGVTSIQTPARSRIAVVLVSQAQQHLGHVGVQRVGDMVDPSAVSARPTTNRSSMRPSSGRGSCAAAHEDRAFTYERLTTCLGRNRNAVDEDRLHLPSLFVTERQVYPLAGRQQDGADPLPVPPKRMVGRPSSQQPQGQALQVAVGGGP